MKNEEPTVGGRRESQSQCCAQASINIVRNKRFSVVFAVVSNKIGNFAVQNMLVIANNVP